MKRTHGFTLLELVIVVTVVVILCIILFPVNPSREKPRSVVCMSNMKQLGLGMIQYVQDYDQHLPLRQANEPQTVSWRSLIYPYTKSKGLYQCPTDPAAKWPDI